METWSLVGGAGRCRYLEADADAAEEGEGPGGQQGRQPAGAAVESTEGHGQAWFPLPKIFFNTSSITSGLQSIILI